MLFFRARASIEPATSTHSMRATKLPLNAASSPRAHASQNAALIILAFAFLPLNTLILLISLLTHFIHKSSAERSRDVAVRLQSPKSPKRTILVTGVGMSKGLAIARCFYAAGHDVIGADFESVLAPIACGRASRALKSFHRLQKPVSGDGGQTYAKCIIDIIMQEKVDLWVSCSGVASAIEDGIAKEMIEALTPCRAIQFDTATTQTLHEKHTFIEYTESIGLSTPDTHTVTSADAIMDILEDEKHADMRYVLKYIGTDDSVRGDMTLLPLKTAAATRAHVSRLQISPDRPWILQQFIKGPEYCTHAVVIEGKVKVFASCPSAELLMHYKALPADSALNQSMLRWTRDFAAAGGPFFTGHLSFDFMVEAHEVEAAKRDPSYNPKLYPIECNPRAHTAVVLFNGTPGVADAYLSLLLSTKSSRGVNTVSNGTFDRPISPLRTDAYYWIGHDLIESCLLPLLSLLTGESSSTTVVFASLKTFASHVLFWKDGTFEVWDPWPAWWLYHVYWPTQFTLALLFGNKWSRVNVSTCKTFMC